MYNKTYLMFVLVLSKMLKDTTEVIRSRNSTDRQYNYPKQKDRQMLYKTLHRKVNIEQHEPH